MSKCLVITRTSHGKRVVVTDADRVADLVQQGKLRRLQAKLYEPTEDESLLAQYDTKVMRPGAKRLAAKRGD